MSTKKPEPYAPDMFSEHARLAQLGARVLEIFAAWDKPDGVGTCETMEELEHTIRDLGLLGEERPPVWTVYRIEPAGARRLGSVEADSQPHALGVAFKIWPGSASSLRSLVVRRLGEPPPAPLLGEEARP